MVFMLWLNQVSGLFQGKFLLIVNFKSLDPFLFTFLRNFFLCQDCWHGDVPPHLAKPFYKALGQALELGLIYCYV